MFLKQETLCTLSLLVKYYLNKDLQAFYLKLIIIIVKIIIVKMSSFLDAIITLVFSIL